MKNVAGAMAIVGISGAVIVALILTRNLNSMWGLLLLVYFTKNYKWGLEKGND